MIPLKLELTNFLSYRQSTILDFHGIHLACISGTNGAGKSTILDAITWALFGKSRARSDDDVVNRLASANGEAAEVRFLFELEGLAYRIIRRKKARKPMSLEFQLSSGKTGWKSLNESKLRDTQAAIEALLRMHYETFINASFLLQGKADEFTTKTANKRKEILANLLGLNEWDRFKDAASDIRKEEQNRLLIVDSRLQEIDEELAQEPERQAALAVVETELESIVRQLESQEKLLSETRRNEALLENQRLAIEKFQDELSEIKRGLSRLQQSQSERQKEQDAYQSLLDNADLIDEGYSSWQEAKLLASSWQEKANAYNALQQEMKPLELEVERERSQLVERKSELEFQAQSISAMREERENLRKRILSAKDEIKFIEEALADLDQQEKKRQKAQLLLQKLEADRKLLSQEANQLKSQAGRISRNEVESKAVRNNLKQAEQALESVNSELASISEYNDRLVNALAERDIRQSEQLGLKQEMDELQDRITRLAKETGGECPLCGQPLSERHRQTVLNQLQSDGQEKGDGYRDNQARVAELAIEIPQLTDKVKAKPRLENDQKIQQQRGASAKARLDEIERLEEEWNSLGKGRLNDLDEKLSDNQAIQDQRNLVTKLEVALKDKTELDQRWKNERDSLTNAEARLIQIDQTVLKWEDDDSKSGARTAAELQKVSTIIESTAFAQQARSALESLQKQVKDLEYNSVAHEEARRIQEERAGAEQRYHELQKAKAAVKPLANNLADLERQILEQSAKIENLNNQLDEAQLQLELLSAGTLNVSAIDQDVNRLREEENKAHGRVATAKQNVSVLEVLRTQRQQFNDKRTEITVQIKRLRLLEKAFGREGVQALLIERALPEIEDDANELLYRLTGGEMSVTFDTQRQLKSSDRVAETLDIHIADSAGERPYENYSGGEQFRVNFAIRLALSKLLTRRAGARLQTLVIDEGFGSQDPNGRQRLIEAINTIQDDFERILVITHIDEMRDAFPSRIEVDKGSAGSSITIL